MHTPPTSTDEKTRVTVPVTQDVLDAFQRLAKASGMSTGRAMGEWLSDTLDAVEFTAQKVEQARAAPKVVMREMHAYALGLADETGALMEHLREKGRADRVDAGVARPRGQASRTPPSNTGVTNTTNKPKGGTRGRS